MLNKYEKKYIANLCNAKSNVCQACRRHNENACESCPISNLLDKELERMQTDLKDDWKTAVNMGM